MGALFPKEKTCIWAARVYDGVVDQVGRIMLSCWGTFAVLMSVVGLRLFWCLAASSFPRRVVCEGLISTAVEVAGGADHV